MDAFERLRYYKVGERDFTGAYLRAIPMQSFCLRGVNLLSANLYRAYLNGARLIDVNLSHGNLAGVRLVNSILINVNLSGADLEIADLRGAHLIDVDLTGANLSRAKLDYTRLCGVNLQNAILDDVEITSDTTFCSTTMPDGSVQNHPTRVLPAQELLARYAAGERNFERIVLHRADLSGANLCFAQMIDASFSYVNFSGANCQPAGWMGSRIVFSDLRNANLQGLYLDYALVICSDFRGANLTPVSPEATIFLECNFSGAKWVRTGGRVMETLLHTTWVDGTIINPLDSDFYGSRENGW